MAYTRNNLNAANAYWSDFLKSGKDESMARCYYAITRQFFSDKISSFTNGMYIRNYDERSAHLTNLVLILWDDEVNFIFDNRRIIRLDESLVSFSSFELFSWMKRKDLEKYKKLKSNLKKILETVSKSGKFSEKEIKLLIAKKIYDHMGNEFIRL